MFENPIKKRFSPEFFRGVPITPGIYLMLSRTGDLLYVGKAKNLRARLISYKHANPDNVGENIALLLPKVRRIEWELHLTEEKAAVREREILRAIAPPHNIADAWQEDYFYIGLGTGRMPIQIELTDSEDSELELHGCYAHRRLVKNAYSALLRLLYACRARGTRFAFPAALCRAAPRYQYEIEIANPRRWRRLISDFLHGKSKTLLQVLIENLLVNEHLPEYVRPGLQRDFDLLLRFADSLESRPRGKLVSQAEMRETIRRSVRPHADQG